MFNVDYKHEALRFYGQHYLESPVEILDSLDAALIRYYGRQTLPDSNGALGLNRQSFVSVACQVAALDLIVYGVSKKNIRYIKAGIKAIRYGFCFQRSDGSFLTDMWEKPAPASLVASVFFTSTAATCLMLLQKSGYDHYFMKPCAEIRRGLQRAVAHLADHQHQLIRQDLRCSHRLMHSVLVFSLAGELFGSAAHAKTGMQFLKAALLMQQDDGIFIESGGFDSSYQATTLLLLQNILIYLKTPPFLGACLESLNYGAEWLKTRIADTGEVISVGNSRTGSHALAQSTQEENIHYSDVIKYLYMHASTMGDLESRKLAKRVFRYGINQMH